MDNQSPAPRNPIGARALNLPEREARMAKLTTGKRNDLPAAEFAEPQKRAYPIEDKAHARNAKARASQAAKAGRMTEDEESNVDAKADAVLGKQ
jgi:hypothetical protein